MVTFSINKNLISNIRIFDVYEGDNIPRDKKSIAINVTIQSNEKSAFIIDHDVYFIDIVSDSLLVFEGKGGVEGFAKGPYNLRNGMNKFLSTVDNTIRREQDTKRPRINKLGLSLIHI